MYHVLRACRLDLYNGSPRALIFLEEPLNNNQHLTPITNCHVTLAMRMHKKLSRVKHLLPEDAIVGHNDHVPGLAEGARDAKTGRRHFDFILISMIDKCIYLWVTY